MFWDEIAFCHAAQEAGYASAVASKAVGYHTNSRKSPGGGRVLSFYYIVRNRGHLANEVLPLPLKLLFHLINVLLCLGRTTKYMLRSALDGVAITCHEGDVTVPNNLSGVLAGGAWIIHAAGRLGQAGVPEGVYHKLHLDGTRNVMVAALATESQPRVLHVSSPGALGPITGGPAAEDAPYGPTNPYERSKAAAERVALEFASRGLPVVIGRPEFVYGPGDRHGRGLFQAVRRGRFFFINGGWHLCHPTFVADAVAGMLLCLRCGRSGAIYHIAGPRPVTFRELGETIAAALGVRPPWVSLPRWVR